MRYGFESGSVFDSCVSLLRRCPLKSPPLIVEVPAHTSQVIRVTLRSPVPPDRERTHRLALEDITEEQAAATGKASIAFKISHNLPIMIAPAAKVVDAVR